MKATVDTASLKALTDWCTRIAPTRPTAPILGAVLLDATDSGISATVTDYETFGRADVQATVDAGEKVAVSSRLLAAVAEAAPSGGRVELVADGGRLRITSQGMKAVLPLMPAEDYPSWPKQEADAARLRAIGGDLLGRVLDTAAAVAHSAEDRESVAKVRLEPSATGLHVVVTDSYRVHFADLPWSEPPAGDVAGEPCYLTSAGAKAAAVMAKNAERVLLGFPAGRDNSLTVGTPGRVLVTRLTDGANYPANLDRFTPTTGRTVTADRTDLLALIKRVSTLSAVNGDRSRHLDGTVADGALTLTAVGDDDATLTDSLDVDHSTDWDTGGGDWVIRANAAFLAESVAAVPAKRVTLLIPGPAKAVLIGPADGEAPDYPARVVLMTIRVK